MEKVVAVLVKKIYNFGYGEQSNRVKLNPVRIIRGIIDNDIIITEDNCKFKCANISESDNTEQYFYIFPISVEKLVKEYLTQEQIYENLISKQNDDVQIIDLNSYLVDYFDEVSSYHTYLEVSIDKFKADCYIYDYNNRDTNKIDPQLDFFTAFDNLEIIEKNYEYVEENYEEVEEDYEIKEEPTKEIVLQEEFIPKISCPSLYNTITKTVIAQDEQIKQILIALKKHYLSEDNKMKANILMAGPTGTGKTEILTQIAKQINVPIAILDSTQFTQEGYVGRSVDQAIKQLYDNADRDINKAKKGILVFDEIDKKASIERETIATKAVLDSLLKIMDGTDYYVPNLGSINTSKMVFVGSGAFSKIVPDFEKEIGFNNQINKKTSYKENVNVDSFIKYGLSPEFIGRINELVLLNDLSINDLVKILLNSDKSILIANRNLLMKKGIKLEYEDKAIEKIAMKAYEIKSGARSLDKVVNDTLRYAYEEIFFENQKFKELIITEQTVEDPKIYKLLKK